MLVAVVGDVLFLMLCQILKFFTNVKRQISVSVKTLFSMAVIGDRYSQASDGGLF